MVKRPSINKQRIIRTLLNNPNGNLSKYQVAKEAWCKFSTAHIILKKLQDNGLVFGTTVVDYKGLINEWLQIQLKPIKNKFLLRNPIKLLKNTNLEYALTTYLAENKVQKYLFPSVIEFYINPSQITEWRRTIMNEGGLIGNGNITILSEDIHAFYKSFKDNSLSYVSIPQLIIDLINEGGVCIEAADKLIEKQENALSKL